MTPSLNNGIFLEDTLIEATSNVDKYHLKNLMKETKGQDMGVIELWAQTAKIERPLYNMARFGSKETIKVTDPDGRWTWKHAVAEAMPEIVEDLDPLNVNKGRGGQPFQIKMNKRKFGHTDIITYDKFQGLELRVTDDEIVDGPNRAYAIYTVTLMNSTDDPDLVFPNQFLEKGTPFFKITSSKTAYDQKNSGMYTEARYKEFYNYVGNTYANVEYSVSDEAALMKLGGMTAEGKIPVKMLWEMSDQVKRELDPSWTTISQISQAKGAPWLKSQINNGEIVRSYVTKLESMHFTQVAMDIESELLWGKGGRFEGGPQSPESGYRSVGLWKQTQNSNSHVFNLHEFTLDMFKAELFNHYNGRVDFVGPESGRDLLVQTGTGGMELVTTALEKKNLNPVFTYDAQAMGVVQGDPMNLSYGYAFTKFKIPYLANVEFEVNPALNPAQANDIENPMVNGHRLSSYSFLFFDVTESGAGNIKLLESAWGGQLTWNYINGSMDYLGRTQGFQSSARFNGYEVIIRQKHKAIWMEDPTKMLRFVMRNPFTGGHI